MRATEAKTRKVKTFMTLKRFFKLLRDISMEAVRANAREV